MVNKNKFPKIYDFGKIGVLCPFNGRVLDVSFYRFFTFEIDGEFILFFGAFNYINWLKVQY